MPVLLVLCVGGLYQGVWDAGLEINLGWFRWPTLAALEETAPLPPLKSTPPLELEFTKLWLEALEQVPGLLEELEGPLDGGSLEEPQLQVSPHGQSSWLPTAPSLDAAFGLARDDPEPFDHAQDSALSSVERAEQGHTARGRGPRRRVDTEIEEFRFSQVPGSVSQTPRTVPSLPDAQPAGSALKEESVSSAAELWFYSAALETTLPLFIQLATDRLDRAMEAVGERQLSRVFAEEELQRVVVRPLRQKFSHQIQGLNVKIHSNGFVGSGIIQMGELKFPLVSRVGIRLENESPRVEIHELHVAGMSMERSLLRALEGRINQSLDRQRISLAFKECEFREGAVWMSVERR